MDLRTYAKTERLTTPELAQKLAVPERTLMKWMSGERTPRAELLLHIQTATGGRVTPADFMEVRIAWKASQPAREGQAA